MRADLDLNSLLDYLCWRYVPGPNTFFRGIRKLRPACLIRWQAGRWQETRYWTPPEAEGGGRLPVRDPVEGFLEIFDEAVRLRMRADVPIGAFLSSGLNSSSIVATLVHLEIADVRTFSVGFRGDEAAELPAAAETARLLGTIHTSVELETDHLTDLMPQLSRGAPMSEAADLPIYLMSREAGRHVKVVLSGEGSDELFAGYTQASGRGASGPLCRLGAAVAGRKCACGDQHNSACKGQKGRDCRTRAARAAFRGPDGLLVRSTEPGRTEAALARANG